MARKISMCENCHAVPVQYEGDWCKACNYAALISMSLDLDPEDRDLSFTVCDECGRTLGNDGLCHNTNCGASPDVGKDWY